MDIAAINSAAPQTASSSGLSQLTNNFDTFLTLLTTQLRNQDPLEPLDTEKFTEQLVQFASVEQSIQTNQHLEALIALQTSSANETALAMVGRIATVESDVAALGESPAQWTYSLSQNAASVSAEVFDVRGALVAVLKGSGAAGEHALNWTGETNNGLEAAAGAYRLVVKAVDADGQPVDAKISSRGRVDAVAFTPNGAEIEIAGQRFTLDAVKRVDADI